MHPLHIVSLLCWCVLLLAQLSLFLPAAEASPYWAGTLVIAMLVPAHGLFGARRYTYKWVGFLTMFFFCVGVAELVSTPALRLYGFATAIGSMLLFWSSIYFARYLGSKATPDDPAAPS